MVESSDVAPEGFGAFVRAHRLRAHLSQEALAQRAGVSDRSVRNVERGGVSSPRPETVRRIGIALGLGGADLEDFLARARRPYWTARADPVPLRLLGPVRLHLRPSGEVRESVVGEEWDPRTRAVLASLALRVTTVVPVDEIVDEVWDARPPAAAREVVERHLAVIRGAFERRATSLALEETHGGYRLLGRRDQVDWYLFGDMVAQGRVLARGGDHRSARTMFTRALDLWRGPGLADIGELPLRQLFPPLMEASLRAAVLDRVEADLALGTVDPLPALLEILDRHPDDNRLLDQVVGVLQRAGRTREAAFLGAGTPGRRRGRPGGATSGGATPGPATPGGVTPGPATPGGVTPGPATPGGPEHRDLPSAARTAGDPGFAAPRARVARGWTGTFVGREDAMDALVGLLGHRHLATLIGPPGVGKSRLAWEAVNRVPELAPDGSWFVVLGDLSDGEALALLDAMEAAHAPRLDPLDRLHAHLLGRRALLVLDDCDRLLAPCADLVLDLLTRHPGLRVLVTSREPLGIPEEVVHRLQPLPVPETRHRTPAELRRVPSVRFFCDRAAAVHPSFELTEDVAPAVAAICRAVDGLPLALELASARVGVLSGHELVSRLTDQLTLLARRGDAATARHASLRAAMATSYGLLDAVEASLFARLSVFAGGFTLRAAEALAPAGAAVLDLLHTLVDKSLVLADVSGELTRYRLLEPVRQYAASLLDAAGTAEVRTRAGEYLLDLAAHAARERRGPRRAEWSRLLDAERSTVAAVLEAALADGRLDTALDLSALLWWWWVNAPAEGLTWYRRILGATGGGATGDGATGGGAPAVDARRVLAASLSASVIASYLSPREAMEYAQRARHQAEQLGDVFNTVRALQHISDIAYELGDLTLAKQAGRESIALCDGLGDYACARCQLTMAYNHLSDLEFDRSTTCTRRAAVCFARLDDEEGLADTELALAEIAVLTGRAQTGVPALERALAAYRRVDSHENIARTATLLARATAETGDPSSCVALLREACDIHLTIGHPWSVANDLDHMAVIASTWGDHTTAATLLAAAESLRAQAGLAPTARNHAVRGPVERAGLRALGPHRHRVAQRNGAGTDLASALAVARSLSGPTRVVLTFPGDHQGRARAMDVSG